MDVVRYSFIVQDFHPLSFVGLPTLPVNPFEKRAELGRAQLHHPITRVRPDETPAVQMFIEKGLREIVWVIIGQLLIKARAACTSGS